MVQNELAKKVKQFAIYYYEIWSTFPFIPSDPLRRYL